MTNGFSTPRYNVMSRYVATLELYRWPSGFPSNLTVWPSDVLYVAPEQGGVATNRHYQAAQTD